MISEGPPERPGQREWAASRSRGATSPPAAVSCARELGQGLPACAQAPHPEVLAERSSRQPKSSVTGLPRLSATPTTPGWALDWRARGRLPARWPRGGRSPKASPTLWRRPVVPGGTALGFRQSE